MPKTVSRRGPANSAGAGEAVEQIVFGVLTKQFGDALVEFLDGADDVSELNGGSFNNQAVRFDNGRVGGERPRESNLLETFRDHGGFAAVMAAIKGLQFRSVDALNGSQSRPALQKIAGLNGGHVSDPVQCLREILLQETGDAVGQSHAPVDDFPALLT